MKREEILRQATLADIPEMVEVELSAWDNGTPPATAEQFAARLEAWPGGQFVAQLDGKITGLVNFMLIKGFDVKNPTSTWNEITNNGYSLGAHQPDGDIIFGINMSCRPDAPPKTGATLLFRMGQLAILHGYKYCLAGGRMPEYHKYADQYTPEEYLWAKGEDGRYLDPEIRFYRRVRLVDISRVIPNYMEDPGSLNYGYLLCWKNPFSGFPKFLRKPLTYAMNFIV